MKLNNFIKYKIETLFNKKSLNTMDSIADNLSKNSYLYINKEAHCKFADGTIRHPLRINTRNLNGKDLDKFIKTVSSDIQTIFLIRDVSKNQNNPEIPYITSEVNLLLSSAQANKLI